MYSERQAGPGDRAFLPCVPLCSDARCIVERFGKAEGSGSAVGLISQLHDPTGSRTQDLRIKSPLL